MKIPYSYPIYIFLGIILSEFILPEYILAQCAMSCIQSAPVYMNNSCSHTVTINELLEDPDNCPGPKLLQIFTSPGVPMPGSPVINSNYTGTTLTAQVTDIASGNYCVSTILVADTISPIMSCGVSYIDCNQSILPVVTGTPAVSDNCDTDVMLSWEDILTIPNGCGSPYINIIKRRWNGVDNWGNSDTCVQTIYIQRAHLSEVTFPPDYDGTTLPPLNCSNIDLNPTHTGWPTLGGLPLGNTCNLTATYTDQTVTVCDNVFAVYRTWTVMNLCTGQTRVDVQIIRVNSTISQVEFPPDWNDIDLPSLDCDDPDTAPSHTGYPSIDGVPIGGYCNLLVTYTDQRIDLCFNSFKLLRIWHVLDGCTDQSATHIQVIKVMDKTAPEIQCPLDVTISTSVQHCHAAYFPLPSLSVSDNCSDDAHLTFLYLGPGVWTGTEYDQIPVGIHQVTYTVTDGCANVGSCSYQLTVVDEVPPVAICDENSVTSLQSDGLAIIPAAAFDDGSHDNCGIDSFLVRRMDGDTAFSHQVTFDCSDDLVQVILRVLDANDNAGECMVTVEVQDKTWPELVCPPDITLDCGGDFNNLSLTGEALAFDNCGVDLTHFTYDHLDNCNEGHYVRTWYATDPAGNVSQCDQFIFIVNEDVFDESDIIWPLDYTAYECNTTLHPSQLEPPYDLPVIFENDCSNVEVAYEDLVFDIAPPACYKIVRTWTVVDWCQVNAPGGGSWSHSQILIVHDNTPPQLICPPDMTVENNDPHCEVLVAVPDITISDCSPSIDIAYTIDRFEDGIIDHSGTGWSVAGIYETGSYAVVFQADDNCGNTQSCAFSILVNDVKKPVVNCFAGVAVDLVEIDSDGNGTPDSQIAQVWDTELLQSISDNCTLSDQLRLRVRRAGTGTGVPTSHVVIFDCNDIGPQPVEVWVGDNADNWDYCETFVAVQDNMGICGPVAASAMVSGNIQDVAGNGVASVTVTLEGSAMPSVATGPGGDFLFAGVPMYSDYTLAPMRNDDPLNGVTTYDIVLITKHILGIAPLNTPYHILAADVNRSGGITAYDLVQLRQLILGTISELPNNTSWRFVRSDYAFVNPANPFMEDIPEVALLSDLISDADVPFTAFKVGDVNGSASPGIASGDEYRTGDSPFIFSVPDRKLKAGETAVIPFYAAGDGVIAYQFTLNYHPDRLQFIESRSGKLAMEENYFGDFADKGALTTSWNPPVPSIAAVSNPSVPATPWFYLVFQAKEDTRLSDVLTLNSRITPALCYGQEGEARGVELAFTTEDQGPAGAIFELYPNEPNPFRETTTIGFHLPHSTTATLRIFDTNGRLITEITGLFDKGYHQTQIDRRSLPGQGVYFYQLETPEYKATKRMVLID